MSANGHPEYLTVEGMPEIGEVYALFAGEEQVKGVGEYTTYDWRRIRDAYRIVDGKSVLDVGVGNGAMLNILKSTGRFEPIVGIDIHRHSMLKLPAGVDYRRMSVTDMQDFKDRQFDTTICMEVLEHVEVMDFPLALSELRRVTRTRLLVTVPHDEPEPVWWYDKGGGHRQSFDDEKLARLFPRAIAARLERYGVPWLLIVEDRRVALPAFKIVTYEELAEVLGVT